MTAFASAAVRARRAKRQDLPRPADGPAFLAASFAALGVFWWNRLSSLSLAPTALRPWARYVSEGESLRHLIAGARPPDYQMPMSALAAAWLAHGGPSPEAARAFFAAALTAFVFAVGSGLGPAGAPAFAAAALVSALNAALFDASPQACYAVLVVIAAGMAVRREREAEMTRTSILAACLGASLLFRSALAFLPPLLAARELQLHRMKGVRSAAVLFLVPYLFLIPWLTLNWTLSRKIVPFENGEANCNVATGALGIVGTVEGSWQSLIDEPLDPNSSSAVLSWAARQVARHPFRYVVGVLRRLAYVFSLHPLLFLAAFGGLWVCRRRSDVRVLGLFAAYFTVIHCLMSVQETYFTPLWPLLALIAGAGLGRLAAGRTSAFEAPLARAGTFVADAGAGALIAGGLVAGLACFSYASAVRSGAASAEKTLDAALSRRPGDAWLRAERGRRRLNARDFAGAAADFDEARSGAGFLEDFYRVPMTAARVAAGRPDALVDAPLEDGGSAKLVFAAVSCLKAGKTACAVEDLTSARALAPALVRGPSDAASSAALWALKADDGLFAARTAELAGYLPDADGDALMALLARLPGAGPAAARKADEWRAVRYQGRKEYAKAISVLGRLLADSPKDAALLGQRGMNRWLAGDKKGAARDLEAAVAADPAELSSVLSYGAILGESSPAKALALYDAALARTAPGTDLRDAVARDRDELLRGTR